MKVTLADWLWFYRTRRRLLGMWRARYFPKKARTQRSPSGYAAVVGASSGIFPSVTASTMARDIQMEAVRAQQAYQQHLYTLEKNMIPNGLSGMGAYQNAIMDLAYGEYRTVGVNSMTQIGASLLGKWV